MKHVHCDKIVAKAVNMELVVFSNYKDNDTWFELLNNEDVAFLKEFDYFLCLPKHKEAVLRGLNGEIAESANENREGWSESSVESWDKDWWYMCDNYVSRTKPKKEKRWIGVNVTTGKTTSAYTHDDEGNYAEDEVRLTNGNLSDWQFIEIEVEV
ncbi:hypothetical protein VPHF89G1_0086 [Vibrio phage F89 g1]